MADVEMVAPHADGDYFHAAEFRNLWQGNNGAGVLTHTITASLTGSDRVITVPAFNAMVPNGSGSLVLVEFAGDTVTADAGDADDPRYDALVLDSAGALALTKGTPTEVTGNVAEPPVPPLATDEILLGIVSVIANATTIANTDVKGRAVNVEHGGGSSVQTPNIEVFTTSDTFDATQVPVGPDGKRWVEVEVLGGGGGGQAIIAGGNAGQSGGGGGGHSRGLVDITGETNITVTVGALGAGGASGGNNNGSPGGQSSFGAFITANGGGGAGNDPGSGGPAAGGDINVTGAYGFYGGAQASGSTRGGNGASGPYGGGGRGGRVSEDGQDATGYGAGGGGAAGNGGGGATRGGGDGTAGIVIVRW